MNLLVLYYTSHREMFSSELIWNFLLNLDIKIILNIYQENVDTELPTCSFLTNGGF